MLRRRLLGLVTALVALPCLGVAWGEEACSKWAISEGGNSSFCIELVETSPLDLDGEVTFTYEVCQIAGKKALSHWILVPQIQCYGTDANGVPYTLNDLVVGATFQTLKGGNWISKDVKVVIGLDPTTQYDGIKFDDLQPTDACHRYTITFDLSKLAGDCELEVCCIPAATKAGNEDIRDKRKRSVDPGYADILGLCFKRQFAI